MREGVKKGEGKKMREESKVVWCAVGKQMCGKGKRVR